MTEPTPLSILIPAVEPTGDFLRYQVQSRSRKRKHIVDMEANGGTGRCSCEDYALKKHADCWHIQQVRKYMTVEVVRGAIKKRMGIE